MRLYSFKTANSAEWQLGILKGDRLIRVRDLVSSAPDELSDLLEQGPDALARIRHALESTDAPSLKLADVTLGMPTRRSHKIVCLGLNYMDHAIECKLEVPKFPLYFLRTFDSLAEPDSPLQLPRNSEQFDFEAEMVAVVGRKAKDVRKENALDYIAGYSIFNDGSVRDYQMRVSQWTIGKNFDRSGSFGPAFVTADELPPGAKGLRISTRLNGQVVQDSNTNQLIFDVASIVADASACMTLYPGDLLVTGTPPGVGVARTPQLWMRAGDVCEVEIERIGVLRNTVARAG